MSEPQVAAPHDRTEPHPHVITIHVNEKPVNMTGPRHTGLEIKQAAIGQHVNIQLDFVLYLLRHNQPNQPIDDTEMVTITEHSRFHAVADDDNS
jgi:hypothetical protein